MDDSKRCWLRWHNYKDTVSAALESLRYDEDFLDITIACDGKSVKAHKLILSACSSYFRKVLKDHPCDHPIVIIDGVDWADLLSLIHFMYSGEVVVAEEQVSSVLLAAASLHITGLAHVTDAFAQQSSDIRIESDNDSCSEDDSLSSSSDSNSCNRTPTNNNTIFPPDGKGTGKRERVSDNATPPHERINLEEVVALPASKKSRTASRDNEVDCGKVLPMKVDVSADESQSCEDDDDELRPDIYGMENGGHSLLNGHDYVKDEIVSLEFEDEDFGSDMDDMSDSELNSSAAAGAAGSGGLLSVNYAALLAAQGFLAKRVNNASVLLSGVGDTTVGDDSTLDLQQVLQSVSKQLSSCSSPPLGGSGSLGYIHPSGVCQQEMQATLEQYQRKLAFHEPRPCPTCKRMYRDAATLRTHIAIMHCEGKEPFSCSCGGLFRTKFDMYQHKKNGHR